LPPEFCYKTERPAFALRGVFSKVFVLPKNTLKVAERFSVAERWALITGASSGIGAAIAQELAARRWNLVLVSRDATLLEEQAALARAKSVQVHVCAADLATSDGVTKTISFLTEHTIKIDALVNNAGFGIHGAFAHSPAADELKMIDVQLKAALELTKACLPGMIERRSGFILNVSSVYAFSPVPNQAAYAACKTFLLSWTRTLALELHNTGVSASVLCPGITQTRFRSRAGMKEKKSAFSMTAEAVGAIGVNGMLRGKTVIVPGWHNWLYTTLASCLPAWVLGRFTLWFNGKRGIAGHAGEKK
jgi:uncharacterized protein